MSFELPLFPLNVVLFPGMPLPLHIFEPRYRLMIGRCLEADRAFGVAQIADGSEGASGTVPQSVGTVAEIIEVAPFADGRMNLQTVGTRRFEILSIRETDDYLIGTCEWLEDDPELDDLWGIAHQTRRILSRYFDSLSQNTELSADLGALDVPQDPFALSMFIGAILSLPSDQKQQLLEMTSTRQRLELEEFLLERADLVQRAFSKHAAHGYLQPPSDSNLGQFANFVSLN
ncbi:MAG TPA: LON peptidase substrate-binding domain-containing protein [Abditibacterium sp.]|jgi:Lon protease-like protein